MVRLLPPTLAAALVVLAACQPAPVGPGTGPSAVPSGTAAPSSVAPTASATATPVTSAAPSVSSQRELVLGTIMSDEGGQVMDATVEVTCDVDPSVNQTMAAPGSYSFRAPVGSTVTVKVSKDGFTTRTRVHKVEAVAGNQKDDPNRLDFGGNEEGMYYALSEYPEISQISPTNLQANVSGAPLVVKFTFSHKLQAETRDQFGHLFQLRFQAPGGEQVITTGSRYNDQSATLEWDESGKVATFTFPGPVVAYQGASSSVKLAFDTTVPARIWPLGDNGRRLGRDIVDTATSGSGARTTAQIAPILRDVQTEPIPTVRPSPLPLWGLMHWTDIAFTLAQDLTPVKVVKAVARPGAGTADDLIEVTFSKPMRGFPEAALDPAALSRANYIFAFGRRDTPAESAAYDASDPSKGGSSPSSLEYDAKRPEVIFLHVSSGTFSRYSRFKLYVDPKVKDIFGAGVQTSTPDPTSHLADNVVEGS